MASISCTAPFASSLLSHKSIINNNNACSSLKLSSGFLGIRGPSTRIRPARLGPSSGSRATCWFKFGKNGVDAENAGIYGSQSRDDFDRDDVEQYFNYMGMLAVEGSYDKMEALLNQNIHPVDILLLLAATEGDKPKIEELLRAGADFSVKDADGRTAIERANSEEIRDFILGFSAKKA
ncbi:PREDICTED: protein LHCP TRANSLOCATION DEFECT [Tarenaya hassleriana]|uniref:protein LHCP TRANSLOCATION DEFECT n=1 Tax=Tarenaya hassleriana TaxID=28532 RepID=UPI00053C6D66|nr:PREDICTED: protein LHCP TRANSLOCATION DEFECT [Tarenaya hassleriana]